MQAAGRGTDAIPENSATSRHDRTVALHWRQSCSCTRYGRHCRGAAGASISCTPARKGSFRCGRRPSIGIVYPYHRLRSESSGNSSLASHTPDRSPSFRLALKTLCLLSVEARGPYTGPPPRRRSQIHCRPAAVGRQLADGRTFKPCRLSAMTSSTYLRPGAYGAPLSPKSGWPGGAQGPGNLQSVHAAALTVSKPNGRFRPAP